MAFLDDIVELKMQESRLARSFNVVSPSHDKLRRRSLVEAVKSASGVALIAEAKRASPTEGRIADYDIVEAAKTFEVHGVSAVSVLTDHKYFGGSIEDLDLVKKAVDLPVLRKDFIVDKIQLTEALLHGADAVLLIAAILGARTVEFVDAAHEMGLECLLEVHGESDVNFALKSSARLIGVNNRDLRTLNVDLSTFERVAPLIPKDRLLVAESGIRTRDDVARMREAGADAVLIGSSIMKSPDIAEKLKELTS